MTLSELNRHEGLTHSYIGSLMEGDETQHDTRPHISFFGLYTCVLVRLFSLCASFVTFLYWFWLLLLLHNLLCAAGVSSYSSEDNNEVITQISRYFLLDYWSTMWKTSALHQRLKCLWRLSLISNKKILKISDDFTLIVPWRVHQLSHPHFPCMPPWGGRQSETSPNHQLCFPSLVRQIKMITTNYAFPHLGMLGGPQKYIALLIFWSQSLEPALK